MTKSLKTDSQPLEKKPTVVLKDWIQAVAVGNREEDTFSTLAGRLIRLEKQISDKQRKVFKEKTGGKTVTEVAGNMA